MKNGLMSIAYKIILIIFAGILIGNLLLFIVYHIPVENISKNAGQAAEVFEQETMDAVVRYSIFGTKLDNYTDSIMLGSAAYDGEESIQDQMVNVYHREYKGKNPYASFVSYYKGTEGSHAVEYHRYWHGYLVVLKPFLSILDYSQIRAFNVIAQSAILILIICLLWWRKLKKFIFPFLMMICFIDPATIPFSLQFSTVYYITMFAVVFILGTYRKIKKGTGSFIFFCCLGMITSYMDLLTYPIMTLGIPLSILCILKQRDGKKDILKDIILCSLVWGIGYLGMWAGKWVSGSIIIQQNLFAGAFTAIGERTSLKQDMDVISYWDVLRRNLSVYANAEGVIFFAFSITGCLVFNARLRFQSLKKEAFYRAIPFLMISLMPFAWYAIAGNHSYIHFWFTFRGMAVSVLSGLSILVQLSEYHRN